MPLDMKEHASEIAAARMRAIRDNEVLWQITLGLRRSDDAIRASLRCWWESKVLLAQADKLDHIEHRLDGAP
ncbi:MAG: hypothetical protein ACTHLO_18605 [Pseudolabrys sp.]